MNSEDHFNGFPHILPQLPIIIALIMKHEQGMEISEGAFRKPFCLCHTELNTRGPDARVCNLPKCVVSHYKKCLGKST